MSHIEERCGKSKWVMSLKWVTFYPVHTCLLSRTEDTITKSTAYYWIKHNFLYPSLANSGVEMLTLPIASLASFDLI